jgi:lipopolysaccharide heptosyltransferase II
MSEWSNCKNLLCVRLDQMGDLLMTTPALKAIKESIEGCHITLMCSPAGAQAAKLMPCIDDCLVYEAPWMKATPSRFDARAEESIIHELKMRRFDGVIIFNVFSQNPLPAAFLFYMAEIPLRLAHCRENPYQLLTHWVKDLEVTGPLRHEVERQLDLVATIGCRTESVHLDLSVPSSARYELKDILAEEGVDIHKPIIVVHPGATATSRRYPAEKFVTAIAQLQGRQNMQIILTGSNAEKELVSSIKSQLNDFTYDLAGRLDLPQLCALIEHASLLISNNTGPAHIAAAVGTPVVDLYALTNPQHTPWLVPSRVLSYDVPCKYCYKSVCPQGHGECLSKIKPEAVVAAAMELLQENICIH